jgi:hypothetical protein
MNAIAFGASLRTLGSDCPPLLAHSSNTRSLTPIASGSLKRAKVTRKAERGRSSSVYLEFQVSRGETDEHASSDLAHVQLERAQRGLGDVLQWAVPGSNQPVGQPSTTPPPDVLSHERAEAIRVSALFVPRFCTATQERCIVGSQYFGSAHKEVE